MASATDRYDASGRPLTGRSISDHGRRLRRLLLPPRKDTHQPPAEHNPFLIPPPLTLPAKKKGFAAVAFRGLGCTTSSAQVYAPASATASVAAAAVRSSADWQGKRSRSRRKKNKAKKKDRERPQLQHHPLPHRKNQTAPGGAAVTAADMWCAPGIGFSAADASVDCVAPHYQQHQTSAGRGRVAAAPLDLERTQREDPCIVRRGGNQEHLSSLLDSPPSSIETPLFGSDLFPPRHLHRARRIRRSPGGLDEIMMFQARLLLGEMDVHDRYREWRLDVDNMTYEELLELGDRIGYVNTGLQEEEIYRCLRKMKHTIFNASPLHFSAEMERKCSICQEDYEVNDEVGKLDCGHTYHMYCIKQWLLRKNACPVCKAAVAKS